jgi:hypothetical protein
MIDDLDCYLCHIDSQEYRRFGVAAFNWLFQKVENDKQVLSVWSICYMIGCNVQDLRRVLLSRQETNDKLRARVIQISDNEFRISKIEHNNDVVLTPESNLRVIGDELKEDQAGTRSV